MQAMSPGKDGGQGITMSQFLFIKQMINNNNLKLARIWLGYLEQRNQKEAAERAQKNIELQNQGNQEAIKIASQAEEQKAQADHKRKVEELFFEYTFKHDEATQGTENAIIQKYAEAILNQMATEQQAASDGEAQGIDPTPESMNMANSMVQPSP